MRARSNGFSVTKTMPAEALLMKPLIDRPGNATALSTPGSFSAMSDILRMTASVRSSVAPSGNCAKLDEIVLVLRRHEARRHQLEAEHR